MNVRKKKRKYILIPNFIRHSEIEKSSGFFGHYNVKEVVATDFQAFMCPNEIFLITFLYVSNGGRGVNYS